MTEETQVRFNAYFCNPPSMQVIDTAGQPMVFISGRFTTKDPSQIALLDKLCETGTGSVFKNKDQLTLSESDLDPMNALRSKFFKEFQEQQAAQLDPTQNVTESAQTRLNPASTTDIAPVTAGHGNVGVSSAALASLMSTKKV